MRLPCQSLLRALFTVMLSAGIASCTLQPRSDQPAASASEPLPLPEDAAAASEALPEPEPPRTADLSARSNPLVERALGALGTRYRYGGSNLQSGFDCSGFVRWVYQDIAAALPRSAQALSEVEAPLIERGNLQAGDLVFFRINRTRTISHVGMYIGNGEFIHSPSSGGRVRVESMETPYWRARFVKARRWSIPLQSDPSVPVTDAG